MNRTPGALRGRGAAENPSNRFERLSYCEELGEPSSEGSAGHEIPGPQTQLLRDPSRTIVARNESPDVGFDASVNPYRGCEHGCVYCYARPTHEYLGFSAGLDFETRILVKTEAPELLRRMLASSRWEPRTLALSGVTDPYQPVEQRLEITRRCLAVLAEFRNPVAIVTKNRLVTRDADLLANLAPHDAVSVSISVTSLEATLQRVMEPRTSSPQLRLEAIAKLAEAGIPVGVMVAPVVPGLNDHEIPAILEAASRAGARFAGWILLRLPHAVAPLFEAWLGRHFPERREKVLNRIRGMRDGRLNDARFGSRMVGTGIFAEQIRDLFALACRRRGLASSGPELSTTAFRRPGTHQMALFG
jgi:DNA repair photolyase